MTEANGVGAEVFNRDINPAASFMAAYPALKPLIENPVVSRAFRIHEAAAKKWKARYDFLGRSALVCVFVVMVSLDFRFTLEKQFGAFGSLELIFAGVAVFGLVIEAILILMNVKDKWLTHRFAAERLRCLKFQAFMLANCPDWQSLDSILGDFSLKGVAGIEQIALGGRSALVEFAPSQVEFPVQHSETRCTPEELRQVRDVYATLRLETQLQHFGSQLRASESRSRFPMLLGEIAFGLGAFLAFGALIAAAAGRLFPGIHIPPDLRDWLDFLIVLMFIVSAIVSVFERGSAYHAHVDRYQHYSHEVRRIQTLYVQRLGGDFFLMVQEMERVALLELFDFCRDAGRSNYIF